MCLLLSHSGNYQRALETYKDIHRKFPENAECNSYKHLIFHFFSQHCTRSDNKFSCQLLCWLGLRFLVRLCTDMGLKEVQDYATKLKKVEKMKEIREQVRCLFLVYQFRGSDAVVLPGQREVKSRDNVKH